MKILVINAGSSSLKYQLIDSDSEQVLAKGLCERIGIDGSCIKYNSSKTGEKKEKQIDMPDHGVALKTVIDVLVSPEDGAINSLSEIDAVGHRVVHGGEYFNSSVLVTDDVIAKIKAFAPVEITDVCKEKIDIARAAYDALENDDQRELVYNYEDLTKAETDYAAAKIVVDLIKAIGNVLPTPECQEKITAAKEAYGKLTADQQALVYNYKDLTDREAAKPKQNILVYPI